MLNANLIQILLLYAICGATGRSIEQESDNKKDCQPLPPELLKEILGSAYNPRYMRLQPPKVESPPTVIGISNGKRETDNNLDDLEFYVDDGFSQVIDQKPAWETDPETVGSRPKRQLNGIRGQAPWSCETHMVLLDLGADYYPRYLRTAKCKNQSCWYGKYTCRPKAFALRILKRQKGVCIPAKQLEKLGLSDRQDALTEMWVWEERAVNFCCECFSGDVTQYY